MGISAVHHLIVVGLGKEIVTEILTVKVVWYVELTTATLQTFLGQILIQATTVVWVMACAIESKKHGYL